MHLGGNLGRALLPVVDKIQPEDFAVVELSSFQLISMRQSPEIAVVTNVTPKDVYKRQDIGAPSQCDGLQLRRRLPS